MIFSSKFFSSKIRLALLFFSLLVILGVVGFRVISNYSWIDAFYMTAITITTVGFGEVSPLEPEAKIFTIFLIINSVVVLGYTVTVTTEYILSQNNFERLKKRKMQKRIDTLKDHVIICGYGRNGVQVAEKLLEYQRDFVVVEKDQQICEKLMSQDQYVIHGNANDDEVLRNAGLGRAKFLISALPDDSDNLFVVLSARQANPTIQIISRASKETSLNKLKIAGANHVSLPEQIGGRHMATLIVAPDLIQFVNNLTIVGQENSNIQEIPVEKLYNLSPLKSLKDLDLRSKTGCTVIGYHDKNGKYKINPEADQLLEPGSNIVVLGREEQIQKLHALFQFGTPTF
jgi:voltage-gated potassium channel